MSKLENRGRSPLASAIKTLREKRGFTQDEFSRELGVNLTTATKYETTQKPSRAMLHTFIAMAEAYGLPELVPIFREAASIGISEYSIKFSSQARLDVAEKLIIDATNVLNAFRVALLEDSRGSLCNSENARRLNKLNAEVESLFNLAKEVAHIGESASKDESSSTVMKVFQDNSVKQNKPTPSQSDTQVEKRGTP